MEFLNSTFSKIHKIMYSAKSNIIYMLSIDSQEDILTKLHRERERERLDEITSTFVDSLSLIPIYSAYGEELTRKQVLISLISRLSVPCFVLNNDKIAIVFSLSMLNEVMNYIGKMSELFFKEFHVNINFSKISSDEVEILDERIKEAHQYYIEEHGEWTKHFMERLGDDISRDSLSTFLRQRVKAHILRNSLTCYPVIPPVKTAPWRKQREEAKYDFPVLEGCREDICQFFYKDTFIYEQYAIQGEVEASSGNIVIDAGAFIGDTACYFSKKVGEHGKVFAFEIVPESAEFARKNMLINNCNNVEIIPLALSERENTFSIFFNEHSNSGASLVTIKKETQNVMEVKSITLDKFCADRNIHVDFLKADIEGSEMQMLNGAKKTISENIPTCAMALYHKQNDYWEIPQFLSELCPEYRFWFRTEAEPVIFAKLIR